MSLTRVALSCAPACKVSLLSSYSLVTAAGFLCKRRARHAGPATPDTSQDGLLALADAIGLDHFGAWFVIALTVMLLNGTLVPFMVAAPKVHVKLPSETVLDPAGAG